MVLCHNVLTDNYELFIEYASKLRGRKVHINAIDIVNDVYIILHKKQLKSVDLNEAKRMIYKYIFNTSSYTIIDYKNKYKVKANLNVWDEEHSEKLIFNEEEKELDNGYDIKRNKLNNLCNLLDTDDKILFNYLIIKGLKMEDVRDITGVSVGHLHNVKKEYKNLINLIK